MLIHVNPAFDLNTKLWRYMNFTKFVSMLQQQALFFCRSDRLGDSHEGSLPFRNANIEQLIPPDITDILTSEKRTWIDELQESTRKERRHFNEWTRQWVLVNCWHMSDRESNAMWEIYAKSKEAIAIQTTYWRFWDCLNQDPHEIYIGDVKYIDYQEDAIPYFDWLVPYFYKRKSFEYEHEWRALTLDFPSDSYDLQNTAADPDKLGKQLSLDLILLIERIIVAPQAPKWFFELVQQVVKKYDSRLPEPIQSSLDSPALF